MDHELYGIDLLTPTLPGWSTSSATVSKHPDHEVSKTDSSTALGLVVGIPDYPVLAMMTVMNGTSNPRLIHY